MSCVINVSCVDAQLLGRGVSPDNRSHSIQGETGPAGAPGPVGSRGGPVSDSTPLAV